MIATLWQAKWWLVSIGPNVIASLLCFAAGLLAGWLKWGRKWAARFREHERKVHELHLAIVRDRGPSDQRTQVPA